MLDGLQGVFVLLKERTKRLWRGNFEEAAPAPDPTPIPPDPRGIPLSTLKAHYHDRPPAALAFSDGTIKQIRYWYGLQIAVVEWLTETGRLSGDDCPVLSPYGAHIVHVSPTKAKGSAFAQPKEVNGLWIQGHGPVVDQLPRAKWILQARGVDPATVRVIPRS